MTQIWRIDDMSCQHCVKHVQQGLSELPGVTEVAVSLEQGTATITGDISITPDEARIIVDELGYTFAGMVQA